MLYEVITELVSEGPEVTIKVPRITEYSPDEVFTGESIILTGEELDNPALICYLAGQKINIIPSSNTRIALTTPMLGCEKEIGLTLRIDTAYLDTEAKFRIKQPDNLIISDITNRNNFV